MSISPNQHQAKPFRAEPSLQGLPPQYPLPEQVARLSQCKTPWGREAFVRLWLAEGTPSVFQNCPGIYEDIRSWLGSRLGVCPKDITLVGSARLGFSLAPPPKYGLLFDSNSDFDLALVSSSAFSEFESGFAKWDSDYESGSIEPRNEKERGYWDSNREFFRRNSPKGFLDAEKLPTFTRYPISIKFNNAMWALRQKLRATPGAPVPRRASIHVYRDWQCFVRRAANNLRSVLGKLGP